jgi:hypothetical protein
MGRKVSVKVDIQAAKHHAEFFLEWEMFRTAVVEKNKTQFMFTNFFQKIVPLMR